MNASKFVAAVAFLGLSAAGVVRMLSGMRART